MTNISTETKNRVIILQDRTRIPISRETERKIMATNSMSMYIEGQYIKLTTINRIEDYFQEKNLNYRDESFFRSFNNGEIKRKDVFEGIKRGLEIYIKSPKYRGTEAPKRLIKMCDERLKEI